MNKAVVKKILVLLVSLLCIAIFLVPQGYSFNPGNDNTANATWEASYLTGDFILLLIYVPFPIAWIFFLLLKKGLVKRILKFLLLGISFLYLLLSLEAAMFIAQDFEPAYGAFIPVLFFPLLVILILNDRSLKKR